MNPDMHIPCSLGCQHWMIFISITLLVTMLHSANAHPMCLNFEPPYAAIGGLDFCSDYSSFGCCSRDDDQALRARYNTYIVAYPTSSCTGYLKAILCLQCNPYAAHLFDTETLNVKKDLPGICWPLCAYIYNNCSSIIPYLRNGTSQSAPIQGMLPEAGESMFCNSVQLSDSTYCYPNLLNNTVLNGTIQRQQTSQTGCLCLEKFASLLRNPLIFTYPDDGSGRIFVGEQVGLVSTYYKNGSRLVINGQNKLFMDISSLVLTTSAAGDERGFLGMACHPKFAVNQKIYVYFSLSHQGRLFNRISEFSTSADDRNTVDIRSERVLFEIEKPYDNHNGGEMLFGPDGYLYITTGDGGGAGDTFGNAQNLSVLLGKVLRIDVDSQTVNGSYGIPPSNPFINVPNARPEIFAYGARNMWRCSFDRGDFQTGAGKGRLFCGDVGQSVWEEVDIIKSGLNYGWNSREGFDCYTASTCGKIGPEEYPIFAYDHSVGQSITGGYVYRGCQYPNLNGRYIYGDYQNGRLFMLTDVNTSVWNNTELFMCTADLCTNGLVNTYDHNILSFGEDFDGDVYMLTTSDPSPTSYTGNIYRLVDPSRQADPALCHPTVSATTTSSTTTTTTPTTATTTTSISSNASSTPVSLITTTNTLSTTTLITTTTTATGNNTTTVTTNAPPIPVSTITTSSSSTVTPLTTTTTFSSPATPVTTTPVPILTNAGSMPSNITASPPATTTTTFASPATPITTTTASIMSTTTAAATTTTTNTGSLPSILTTPSTTATTTTTNTGSTTITSTTLSNISAMSPTTTTLSPLISTTTSTPINIITSVTGSIEPGQQLWSCSFDLPQDVLTFCGMIQAIDDEFDWTIYSGPTPSNPTGPDAAFNGINYIYIEASSPRQPNDTAKLYLPSLSDLGPKSNVYCLSFNYHMFGFHIRELQLFIESTNTSGYRLITTIWRSIKEKGNFWLSASVTINMPEDQSLANRIGFVGVRGDEYSGDIGLDNISLSSGACSN